MSHWMGIVALLIAGIMGIAPTGSGPEAFSPAQEQLAQIIVESKTAFPTQETTVTVQAQNVPFPGIVSIQGRLRYDPNVLQVQDVRYAANFNLFLENINQPAGEVRFAATSTTNQPVSGGFLLEFIVVAADALGAKSDLILTIEVLSDPNFRAIRHKVVNGTFTIGSEPSPGDNQRPSADFTFSPASPTIGETVQFTDRSTDPDGSITRRRWDFGDGSESTERNPTHQYSQSGTYTVSLRVTDDQGATNTVSKKITVRRQGELPPSPKGVSVRNFPNPARTQTIFLYNLPQGTTRATLQVFSLSGALIFTKALDVDAQQFAWNLRDGAGRNLLTGAYYYRVSALTSGGARHSPVGRLVIRR